MVGRLTLGIFALALVSLGCRSGSDMGSSRELGSATHWHTKIYRGTEGKVGEAKSIAHSSMTRLTADRTRASITLPGLLPRGEYAWGVYEGTCDAPGALMGGEEDYPTISPDANSMGSFTAMIDASFDPSTTYQVTIFTNGGTRDQVLGCNRLRVGTEAEFDEEEEA